MSDWIALRRCKDEIIGYAMQDGALVSQAKGHDQDKVIQELGGAQSAVCWIGNTDPSPLPAPILPQAGLSLKPLSQSEPLELISAWTRLLLAGLNARHPDWDGVVIRTEDQVHFWIHMSAGEVISVRGFVTPKLVAALGGDHAIDTTAVADSLSRPERLATFLRSAALSGDAKAVTGYLLGAEFAAARPYWLGQQVAVIKGEGVDHLSPLREQSVPVFSETPDLLVEPGLRALGEALGL